MTASLSSEPYRSARLRRWKAWPVIAVAAVALWAACIAQARAAAGEQPAPEASATQAREASGTTAARNAAVRGQLPFADRSDFDAVRKGLIAPFEGQVRNAAGQVVWDTRAYDFLRSDPAPDSVNPSLWRLAQLNATPGLFNVADGSTRCAAWTWRT